MPSQQLTPKGKIKVPHIKIDKTALETFLLSSLEVDPYWDDLYNPKDKKKTKQK